MAGPYRIVLFAPNDTTPYFYWRDAEKKMLDGSQTPEFSLSASDARFKHFHRIEDAVAERDRFRKYWPGYRIIIQRTDGSSADPQFEDRAAEVGRTEAPIDSRVAHHAVVGDIDILIVPGSDRYWYVRFPGSGVESIRGATADEAAQAYAAAVALYPHIAEHVERHVVPEPTDAERRAQIEDAKRELKFGPGRRRPGDFRR